MPRGEGACDLYHSGCLLNVTARTIMQIRCQVPGTVWSRVLITLPAIFRLSPTVFSF